MVAIERGRTPRPKLHTPHRALLVALASGRVPIYYLAAAFGLTPEELAQARSEATHCEKWD